MEAMDSVKPEIARLFAAKEPRRLAPPRNGSSRTARARYKSPRVEDRRARRL